MKWLYSLLMVFLLVLTGQSQTNVISVNVGDYGLVPKATMVTLTLISPNPRTYNNILISQVPISITTSSNGIGYFTNIIWGQYRADINANPVTKFLFVVNTNSTGAISLASLVSNPQALPPNPATNYYTQAQIDSLLSGIIASQGITNAYATNAVGVVVTNRLAFISTNYASVSFVSNLVANTTNFSSIIVTNDINRGTNATGTGTTGGNGLSLSISSGGSPALSPGTGGNGGTVSISAGQSGNGTLGHGGTGGTVSIGQGGYGSSLPGTGGTVSIANGGGGYYGTGTGGTVNIATNGGSVYAGILTAFGNFTTLGNSDIQGTLFNSTGTLYINQAGNSIDGAGINIQSGNGDNVGPNSPGGALSIATGTSYGAQNNAADLSIQAGNGSGDSSDPAVYGRGSDVNIAAGTGSGGYRDGKINLNGTVTVLGSISGNGSGLTNLVTPTNFSSITVTNSATMLSNVFIANNLYVTNHAYDVSTSQLDPLANEYVTASYVQSVMAANFDLYFSTNSSGISITNVGTPSTMVVANPINSQTNTISSFTNGTYFTARLQTNSISYIQSVPINLYTYVQITGGGSVTAHPEMWLYNTNGTTVKLGYSSDNEYSSSISVPVNLAIALTNTPYLNVNLTNSPQLLLRWYVTSTTGNPTWRFLIGNGNVSHITVGTIPSASQNYVGTFTGNGSGLTNIPATGIVGTAVTNNASPTLTGLSVGAQTALDVNGNGKVGGVTHTNGLLTATSLTTPTLTVSTNLSISGNLTASSITFTNLVGDGSGLTNVYFTNLTITKVPLNYSYTFSGTYWNFTGGLIQIPVGTGPAQAGYLNASPFSFGNATGSKIVAAIAVYATNSTSFSINANSLFMTNSVGVNSSSAITVPIPSANTVFYYYVTNTIGSITNLQNYNIGPYNSGTTTIFVVGGSCYAFLIP